MSQSQSGSSGGIESPRVEAPGYDDAGSGALGAVPSLARRTVVAAFDSSRQADAAADALRQAGYGDDDVSIVLQGEGSAPAQSADQTKSGRGTFAGAAVGALIGGALGLVSLAVPGVGEVLPGGAIAAVAGGAIAGGAVAALIGSFAGLGVPTRQAQAHEEAVRSGAVTVTVKTADETKANEVIALLNQHGASSATSYQPAL